MTGQVDWKKLLGTAGDLLESVSPIVGAAVKAGLIAEQAYEDYLRELRSNAYIDILVPALRSPGSSPAASNTPQAG